MVTEPQGHHCGASDAFECRLIAKELALLVHSFNHFSQPRVGWKREQEPTAERYPIINACGGWTYTLQKAFNWTQVQNESLKI